MEFQGQYLDAESGLYYLRARYYDPTTAQFLTLDPAVARTMSRYTYGGGDPINSSDPSGLFRLDNLYGAPLRGGSDPDKNSGSGGGISIPHETTVTYECGDNDFLVEITTHFIGGSRHTPSVSTRKYDVAGATAKAFRSLDQMLTPPNTGIGAVSSQLALASSLRPVRSRSL